MNNKTAAIKILDWAIVGLLVILFFYTLYQFTWFSKL